MKLEEGMYARTKDGAIAKVEQIIDNEIHFNIKPIFSDGECLGYNWFYIKDVVKASHNIIDLIEVGDYVNGYKVLFIDKDFSKTKNIKCIDNSEERQCFYEEDIKSIVTKERFESMQYKVGK